MFELFFLGLSADLDRAEAERLERLGNIEKAAELRFSSAMGLAVAFVVMGAAGLLVSIALASTSIFAPILLISLLLIVAGGYFIKSTKKEKAAYIQQAKRRIELKNKELRDRRLAEIAEEERIRAEIRAELEAEMRSKRKW